MSPERERPRPPAEPDDGRLPDGAFQIGDWQVRPDDGVVERDGQQRHLQPQQMDLLVFLATHRGRVIPKEEILERVWHGAVVEEVALPRCVSELRRALDDDARAPRYIETLPKRGYRLIAAVRPVPPPLRRRLPRIVLGVALALVLAVAVLLPGLRPRPACGPEAKRSAAAAEKPPAVAILELDNLSGDPGMEWLSTALQEMLSTELARSPALGVVPSWIVAERTGELRPGGSPPVDDDFLQRLRLGLGADFVVRGAFLKLTAEDYDRLRLDLHLLDCVTGETLTASSETGGATEIFDLVALAARQLRDALDASGHGEESPPAPAVANPLAARLYSEGLRKLRRFEAAGARELLERSIAEDEGQPMAHLALAEAWSAMGYSTKAQETSGHALKLASRLPRERRLWIEARHRALTSQWDEAIEVYRALWVFVPENLEYGLELARSQNASGEPLAARRTLAEIRERAGAGYEDQVLELVAAESAQLLAEYEETLQATAAAAEIGARQDADLVVARARHLQAEALWDLGRVDEAKAALEWAEISFAALGDRRSVARARSTRADWRSTQGDYAGARELLQTAVSELEAAGDRRGVATQISQLGVLAAEEGKAEEGRAMQERAVSIYREIGDPPGEAQASEALAILHAQASEYERARELFQRALQIYQRMGNRERAAGSHINLGRLLQFESRPRAAAERFDRAVTLLREVESPIQLAILRFNQGHLHLQMGELDVAGAAFSEAVSLFRRLKNPRMLSASLNGVGGVRMMQDDLAGARAAIEGALDIRLELGHPARIVNSRFELAIVLLELGELEAAEEMARTAVREVEAAPRIWWVPSWRTLATILTERGKLEEAREAIEKARRDLDTGTAISTQLLAIAAAHLSSAAGDAAAARAALVEVIAAAGGEGAWAIRVEAELVLAEVELRAGDLASARKLLAGLTAEAGERDQALILRKARELEKKASELAGAS